MIPEKQIQSTIPKKVAVQIYSLEIIPWDRNLWKKF